MVCSSARRARTHLRRAQGPEVHTKAIMGTAGALTLHLAPCTWCRLGVGIIDHSLLGVWRGGRGGVPLLWPGGVQDPRPDAPLLVRELGAAGHSPGVGRGGCAPLRRVSGALRPD